MNEASLYRRPTFWTCSFGIWTGLGLVSAVAEYWYFAVGTDSPLPFWQLAIKSLPGYWLWAMAMPFIFWVGTRVPLGKPFRSQHIAMHVVLLVSVSAGHAYALLQLHRFAPVTAPLRPLTEIKLFPVNCITYAAILAAVCTHTYYTGYRDTQMVALRLKSQLAESRLEALQLQLNPHFLFNALNTVAMLVRGRQNDEAVRMVSGVSDILRATLDAGNTNEISLRQEINFVQKYLDIQQARFGDRLNVTTDIPDDLCGAMVPALILLPIVENAVQHGVGTRSGGGRIEISASAFDNSLLLQVLDANSGEPSGPKHNGAGIGLYNTRARLEQMYGPRQKLLVVSRVTGETCVEIHLPLTTVDESTA